MPIFREIVFTKTPLQKVFRYNDEFQLIPYKSEIGPEITKYVVDYPCFLEYSLPENKCDIKAQLAKEREICVLLTAFSIYRVFVYDIHASSWGVKVPLFGLDAMVSETDKEIQKQVTSQVCEFYYPCFYYKDIRQDLIVGEFAHVDVLDRMKLLKHYYSYISCEQDRFDIRNKAAELELSEETLQCLNAYYCLDKETKIKVFSAARLISDSIALKDYRYSLSFLAGVASLETLAEMVYHDNEMVVEDCHCCHAIKLSPYHCSNCGRPIWGVTAKVKKFLNEYVSGDKTDVKNYNAIYDLRSKITHLGDIFSMDTIFKASEKKEKKEFYLGYKLIEYARRGMIGVMSNQFNPNVC